MTIKVLPILVTSVLTAYLAHFFTVRKLRIQRKDKAEFIASTIAFKLEAFAVKVAKHKRLIKLQNNADGMLGQPKFGIPTLEKIELSDDLEALPNALLNEVIDIIQDVEYSLDDANFWGFVEGDFSKDESLEVHSNRLALKSLNSADRLRKHFGGKPRDLKFHKWDARNAIHTLKQY